MNRLLLSLASLALVLAPAGAMAEKLCFRIVNRTGSHLTLENKEGDRTYPDVPPYSKTPACCDPLYEKLCFDKSDNSTKVKVNALVGDKAQEFSGDSCRKLYVTPGMAILVTRQVDGRHINCRMFKKGEKVEVAADFDELDTNHDGKLDEYESSAMDLGPMHYSQADHNGDKIIDKEEYTGFLQEVNVFRGVPF